MPERGEEDPCRGGVGDWREEGGGISANYAQVADDGMMAAGQTSASVRPFLARFHAIGCADSEPHCSAVRGFEQEVVGKYRKTSYSQQ